MGVGKLEAYPTWRKLPACDYPGAARSKVLLAVSSSPVFIYR